MVVEWWRHGKPTLIGTVTGTIAGLATITPASGFVGPMGGLIIGIAAGLICYASVHVVKQVLKVDDSLDVFAVHGVGGMLGILMVSFLALGTFQGLGLTEGFSVAKHFGVQITGIVSVAIWSGLISFVLLKVTQAVVGLRVTPEAEIEGLDITEHGERGYEI
jgi:Amt family ammonium transporter